MAKCIAQDYFSIQPSDLIAERAITFDLYIHLELNDRIVRFKITGEVLSKELITQKVDKGLKFFHIRNQDREAFQAYLGVGGATDVEATSGENATQAPSSDVTSPQDALTSGTPEATGMAGTSTESAEALAKKEFVPEVAPETLIKDLIEDGPQHEKAIEESRKMVDKILKSVPGVDDLAIAAMVEAKHSTNVAIYSSLFAMGLGRREAGLLQDLVVASLLHDIGLTQIEPRIASVPARAQDAAQKLEFAKHASLALELLPELGYTPNARVQVMLGQHHEKFNGSGYPTGLDSFKIDEYAQMIGIADILDTICSGSFDGKTRSMAEALDVIGGIEKQTTFPEYFNPEVFKKVMKWLKNSGAKDVLATATTTVGQTKEQLMKAS